MVVDFGSFMASLESFAGPFFMTGSDSPTDDPSTPAVEFHAGLTGALTETTSSQADRTS